MNNPYKHNQVLNGPALRSLRLRMGLSQRAFCEKYADKWLRYNISRYERGQLNIPNWLAQRVLDRVEADLAKYGDQQ